MIVVLLETYSKQKAGKIVDLPIDEAQRLIDQGYANLLESPAAPKKIDKPAPQKGAGKEKRTR